MRTHLGTRDMAQASPEMTSPQNCMVVLRICTGTQSGIARHSWAHLCVDYDSIMSICAQTEWCKVPWSFYITCVLLHWHVWWSCVHTFRMLCRLRRNLTYSIFFPRWSFACALISQRKKKSRCHRVFMLHNTCMPAFSHTRSCNTKHVSSDCTHKFVPFNCAKVLEYMMQRLFAQTCSESCTINSNIFKQYITRWPTLGLSCAMPVCRALRKEHELAPKTFWSDPLWWCVFAGTRWCVGYPDVWKIQLSKTTV